MLAAGSVLKIMEIHVYVYSLEVWFQYMKAEEVYK